MFPVSAATVPIGEVVDEHQVVRLRRIPVHPDRHGAIFSPGGDPLARSGHGIG